MKKFNTILLISFFFLCAGFPEVMAENFQAHWIWYPEKMIESTGKSRFFRKDFMLDAVPVSAIIRLAGDDQYTLYVNGEKINNSRSLRNIIEQDIKRKLIKGKNTIAVEVRNDGGPAGLLCLLTVKLPDQRELELVSDGSWRSDKLYSPNWEHSQFDDSSWDNAIIVDNLESVIWMHLIPYRKFMKKNEIEKQELFAKSRLPRLKELGRKLMHEENLPEVKLIFENGNPWIISGSERFTPHFYAAKSLRTTIPGDRERLAGYAQAGINLYFHTVYLGENTWTSDYFWRGPNQFNAEFLEQSLLDMIDINPKARFIVLVNLVPPKWWKAKNSAECIGYATGPATEKADDFAGRPVLASMASELWKKETGDAVRQLVERLNSSPAGRRIIGYQLDYGIYTEWHYYGMVRNMPDIGPRMTEAFRNWLRSKYDNNAALLQTAWNEPQTTFENASVPGKDERLKRPLLALRAEQKVTDYLIFHNEVVRDALLHFNRVIKESTGDRLLVGNYFGYMFNMDFPVEGWHLETERILNSSASDYMVAPYCYGNMFRPTGEPGSIRTASQSFRNHGKLHIVESDTRTSLTRDYGTRFPAVFASDLEESVTQLSRDFCNALINGCGISHLDFNRGWLDDPKLLEFISKTIEISKLNANTASVAEVAFVCDFESVTHHSYSDKSSSVTRTALDATLRELGHAGTPFDVLFFNDLRRKDIPKYKVYIFPNLYFSTPKKQQIIERLRADGATLVWVYAPGFITAAGAVPENIFALTGIKSNIIMDRTPLFSTLKSGSLMPEFKGLRIKEGPFFYIDDPLAVVLGTSVYQNRKYTSIASKKRGKSTDIYCTTPFLGRMFLRDIFRQAGVHLYSADTNDVFMGCKSFVALHTAAGGTKELILPHAVGKVTQLLPERKEIDGNISRFRFEAPPKSTFLFHIENP